MLEAWSEYQNKEIPKTEGASPWFRHFAELSNRMGHTSLQIERNRKNWTNNSIVIHRYKSSGSHYDDVCNDQVSTRYGSECVSSDEITTGQYSIETMYWSVGAMDCMELTSMSIYNVLSVSFLSRCRCNWLLCSNRGSQNAEKSRATTRDFHAFWLSRSTAQ